MNWGDEVMQVGWGTRIDWGTSGGWGGEDANNKDVDDDQREGTVVKSCMHVR